MRLRSDVDVDWLSKRTWLFAAFHDCGGVKHFELVARLDQDRRKRFLEEARAEGLAGDIIQWRKGRPVRICACRYL